MRLSDKLEFLILRYIEEYFLALKRLKCNLKNKSKINVKMFGSMNVMYYLYTVERNKQGN